MADVTVKRTEEFEPIYHGGMLRARAGLGVTSFGMQILRLPPNTDRYPEHDHSASGQEEVFTVLDGAVTLRGGRRGSARARSLRASARETASCLPATRATVLALGGCRAPPSSRSPTRTRASRTRSMADVTVKRLGEFEAIFGGGFTASVPASV